MGRSDYGNILECADSSVSLFKVNFVDGDYDDGGAYWSGGYGCKPLWCARNDKNADPDYRAFARASTRAEAAKELSIPKAKLITKKGDGI
jgi:hypothetical protein